MSQDEHDGGAKDKWQGQHTDWAAKNARDKRKVAQWAAGEPAAHLLVMAHVSRLVADLMHDFIWVSSNRWCLKNELACQRGMLRQYRLLDAHSCRAEGQFARSALFLFADSSKWRAMPRQYCIRECCALAFRMLSRIAAGCETMLRDVHIGFTFKLFGLLSQPGAAAEILASPCAYEEFTETHIKAFPTTALLQSPASLQCLAAIAEIARSETTQIECGHACGPRAASKEHPGARIGVPSLVRHICGAYCEEHL